MAAECEVESCGVIAIGRCFACKRAFCTSHRWTGGGRSDWCVVCHHESQVHSEAVRSATLSSAHDGQRRIDAVVKRLRAKGSPGTQTLTVHTMPASLKNRLIGRSMRPQAKEGPQYWAVGQHAWHFWPLARDARDNPGHAETSFEPTMVLESGTIRRGPETEVGPMENPSGDYGTNGDLAEPAISLPAIADALEAVAAHYEC